jgi:hypothetical protein
MIASKKAGIAEGRAEGISIGETKGRAETAVSRRVAYDALRCIA